jgi:hypothetical protein
LLGLDLGGLQLVLLEALAMFVEYDGEDGHAAAHDLRPEVET